MAGTAATIVAAVLVVLLVSISWFTSPTWTSHEPPPIPYTIPILGHAITFIRHRRRFLVECAAKSRGQPFSLFIAGRKHYVYSNPGDVAAIYRSPKTLDIKNFVKLLRASVFGTSRKGTEQLVDLTPKLHHQNTEYLLNSERNSVTAIKYFVELEKLVSRLDHEVESSATGALTKDGFVLTGDIQGVATVEAYLGPEMLNANPHAMADFTTYAKDGFWPMLFGTPRFLIKTPYAARDRLVATFGAVMKSVGTEQQSISPFMLARIVEGREWGLSEDTIATELLSEFFALNANSIPTGYLILLHLVSYPGLIAEIREELASVGYDKLQPSELISIFPTKLPKLHAVFWETMRRHNTSTTIREVLEPTKLEGDRTWNLQKGSVVEVAATLLHMDPELHPNPLEFRPKRFLDTALGGEGESSSKSIKPFGGGTSYCPGRVFAEKQVLGYVAALITRFDIRIVNEECEIPDVADFEIVAACPRFILELRKRVV